MLRLVFGHSALFPVLVLTVIVVAAFGHCDLSAVAHAHVTSAERHDDAATESTDGGQRESCDAVIAKSITQASRSAGFPSTDGRQVPSTVTAGFLVGDLGYFERAMLGIAKVDAPPKLRLFLRYASLLI
jgi:hypothetical protein